MCNLRCKRLGLCALFLCCLAATAIRASAAQSDVPSFINPAHRQALQSFLKTKPYLRVATYADADEQGKSLLGNVSGGDFNENKSPYYAVGDFNNDGREDFAIAFVNTRRPKDFPVAIFNGPFKGRRWVAPAYYNESKFGTDAFLLASTDERPNQLVVGITGGDMTVMLKPRRRGSGYYVWEGMTQ
ncbi:MAG: hypothetical protein QOH25_2832 [Acidobacteriota bacterium]|jgi:hypothetical protein|nr:hypothetical protein [Acidobacteriota bacterium]